MQTNNDFALQHMKYAQYGRLQEIEKNITPELNIFPFWFFFDEKQ